MEIMYSARKHIKDCKIYISFVDKSVSIQNNNLYMKPEHSANHLSSFYVLNTAAVYVE